MLPYTPTDDLEPGWRGSWLKTYYDALLDYSDAECDEPLEFGDPDSEHIVLWQTTGKQWGEILACILQGAVEIYPNDVSRILYNYMRMADCPMSFCDQVLACILSRVDIQNAIRDVDDGSQGGGQYHSDDVMLQIPVGTCDKNIIYGYARALWNYIDAKTVDVLERLDELTNVAAQADALLSLIPGFSALPVSGVLDWIGNLGEFGLDAYNSQKTVELEDQIVCALMCIAYENDCTLSFGATYDYFLDELGGTSAPTIAATFAEWVTFMLTGTYPGDRVVFLMTAFQLGAVAMGVEWGILYDVSQYSIQAKTGEPSPDWELLCDPCREPCGIVTFSSLADMDYYLTMGHMDMEHGDPAPCAEGDEWSGGGYPYGKRTEIDLNFDEDKTIESVAWDLWMTSPGFPEGEIHEKLDLYDSNWGWLGFIARTWQPVKGVWQSSQLTPVQTAGVRHLIVIHEFTVAETEHTLRTDNYAVTCAQE